MKAPDHRRIGKLAGEIRRKLQKLMSRRKQLTQEHVAELSEELLGGRDLLTRQAITDIESGSKRPVHLGVVVRYIDVLRAIASGSIESIGLSCQSPLVDELDELRSLITADERPLELNSATSESCRLARNIFSIPGRVFDPQRSAPGALLRADYRVVPFHGRDSEFEDLRAWCTNSEPIGLRLYTGPGGTGKTRLLLELCSALSREGFVAGFVRHDACPADVAAQLRQAGPILLVFDYAENRRDELAPILSELHEVMRTSPARVVLLARAALDWWQALKLERGSVGELISGPLASRISLKPLALTVKERVNSYSLALAAFSQLLRKVVAADKLIDLEGPQFERVLLIHLAALSAIEGADRHDEQALLDFVVAREKRFWRERANAVGVPETLVRGIGQVMAAVTLSGGAQTRDEAVDIAMNLPFLSGQPTATIHAIVSLLREIYPGTGWIEPVLPDLLGEHLVQQELATHADELLNLVMNPSPQV